MSFEITESFIRAYSDNFIAVMQQKESRLQPTVRVEGGVRGKARSFDPIGAVTARKRTTRHGDTYNVSTPHSRRWALLDPYDIGDLTDEPDKIRSLTDPTSEYLQNFIRALNRSKDDVIIAALGGSATAGEEATTTVALPTAQKIATSSLGMTTEKVLTTLEMLNLADADPDEDKYMVVAPKQVTDMLKEVEATSSDYTTLRPLQDGKIVYWGGFNWIMSNRLSLSSTTRYCYGYLKRAIGLAVGADIKTKMAERADKSFSTQAFGSMDLGAVRIEDAAVIQVACTES